jgi:hypothetical protein
MAVNYCGICFITLAPGDGKWLKKLDTSFEKRLTWSNQGQYAVEENKESHEAVPLHQVSMLLNFFPLSLTMRPNKLEVLSLETLSSQVLEFEGKARANPIGVPFRCFLLG